MHYKIRVWYKDLIPLTCLSVCLYPINVQTAEPIGPKFGVGPSVTLQERFINEPN